MQTPLRFYGKTGNNGERDRGKTDESKKIYRHVWTGGRINIRDFANVSNVICIAVRRTILKTINTRLPQNPMTINVLSSPLSRGSRIPQPSLTPHISPPITSRSLIHPSLISPPTVSFTTRRRRHRLPYRISDRFLPFTFRAALRVKNRLVDFVRPNYPRRSSHCCFRIFTCAAPSSTRRRSLRHTTIPPRRLPFPCAHTPGIYRLPLLLLLLHDIAYTIRVETPGRYAYQWRDALRAPARPVARRYVTHPCTVRRIEKYAYTKCTHSYRYIHIYVNTCLRWSITMPRRDVLSARRSFVCGRPWRRGRSSVERCSDEIRFEQNAVARYPHAPAETSFTRVVAHVPDNNPVNRIKTDFVRQIDPCRR